MQITSYIKSKDVRSGYIFSLTKLDLQVTLFVMN